MSTEKNLKAAFAGESQANRKYLAFAKQADFDGFPAAAKLFRAAAEAETIHALSHLKALGVVGTTEENLKAAVEGETFEFTEMYPGFITEAEAEGNQSAKVSFHLANQAEEVHANLYKKALASIEKGQDNAFYVCEVCGNIVEGNAPDKCSICGAPTSKFKNVG